MKAKLNEFIQKIFRDDLPTQAAALAYCASLSIAPLILLILSLMSFIGLDLHEELNLRATNFLGPKAAIAITDVIEASQMDSTFRAGGSVFGLITLFLSASAVVVQLHSALNQIYGPAKYASQIKAFFIQRGLSLLVVLFFIVLTVFTLITSALLNSFTNPDAQWWGTLLNTAFTFISFSIAFTLVYRLIPDCPPGSAACFKSALITSTLFIAGKAPLAAFLSHALPGSVYGAAGSLILFLLWVYYSSVVIYLGAELSAFLDKEPLPFQFRSWMIGHGPEPS